MDDQRYMQRALVNKVAVRVLSVLPQTFAVIGKKHNERLVQQRALRQEIQKAPEYFVHIRQLGLVARARESRPYRRRQILRRVQIKEVQKNEKWRCCILADPLGCAANDVFAQTLQISRLGLPVAGRGKWAVVHIESLIETEALVENKAAYERRRSIAAPFEHTRQCDHHRRHLPVVLHAI